MKFSFALYARTLLAGVPTWTSMRTSCTDGHPPRSWPWSSGLPLIRTAARSGRRLCRQSERTWHVCEASVKLPQTTDGYEKRRNPCEILCHS